MGNCPPSTPSSYSVSFNYDGMCAANDITSLDNMTEIRWGQRPWLSHTGRRSTLLISHVSRAASSGTTSAAEYQTKVISPSKSGSPKTASLRGTSTPLGSFTATPCHVSSSSPHRFLPITMSSFAVSPPSISTLCAFSP